MSKRDQPARAGRGFASGVAEIATQYREAIDQVAGSEAGILQGLRVVAAIQSAERGVRDRDIAQIVGAQPCLGDGQGDGDGLFLGIGDLVGRQGQLGLGRAECPRSLGRGDHALDGRGGEVLRLAQQGAAFGTDELDLGGRGGAGKHDLHVAMLLAARYPGRTDGPAGIVIADERKLSGPRGAAAPARPVRRISKPLATLAHPELREGLDLDAIRSIEGVYTHTSQPRWRSATIPPSLPVACQGAAWRDKAERNVAMSTVVRRNGWRHWRTFHTPPWRSTVWSGRYP